MKRYKLYLSILATILTAMGCDDASNSEGSNSSTPECQADVDTWKCDNNTLSKCIGGNWELIRTCEDNTQCDVAKGSCVPNDPLKCTNDAWKCDGNVLYKCVSAKWEINQTCENTTCNAETGSCVPNDKPECTNDTWKCNGNTLYKCVFQRWETNNTCEDNAKCNAEKGSCDIECKASEHLFAGKCEADDVNHCGTHTNDCSTMSGWKTGSCFGKKCFAEECQTGYHLASKYDNDNEERTVCEEDTHDACGSSNRQCGTEEICTQGKCKDTCQPGEVICNGSCINPNTSPKFCGADASCVSFIPCSEYEDCIGGKCVLSSCPKAEESICTVNDQNLCINVHGNNPNHCGACGAVCSDKQTAKTSGCNHGQCTYLCNDGMVNCGSDTEPTCLPEDQLKSDPLHCGKCDTTCKSNEFCQNGQCIISSCTGNECLMNNACINQNEHCGIQCLNCNTANHASAGICQNGSCAITACAIGYHLTDKGECELDSATACPNGKATGTVNCNTIDEYTKTGICEEGVCKATSCDYNIAHIKDNKCIANTIKSCGSETDDCTQLAGWNTGVCDRGRCIATTCQNGFCLDPLYRQCTNAQTQTLCGTDGVLCRSCGIKQFCSDGRCIEKKCNGNVCQQQTSSYEEDLCQNDDYHCGSQCLHCPSYSPGGNAICNTTTGTCEITSCIKGYHLYNNFCEKDSITNCGTHGTQCNVANATNVCTNGLCTFTCDTGYHSQGSACEADSTANCGADGTQCNVANATNACTNGVCTFTCDTGYHSYGSACEEDSLINCGAHGTQCNVANATNACTNGTCTFTCDSGYHEYGSACEANSTTNCGAHGTQCNVANATNACTNGACTFTCDSNYHAFGSVCEENSTTHCGAHGTQCNVANATNACTNGTCTFTCNTGYHAYGSVCEADSTANCGAHGTQCNVANVANACTNGVCTFTCDTGYHKYDSACEEDTPEHCGTHTTVCAEGSDCIAGVCSLQICNGILTNIHTDIDNCGACDNFCVYGLNCINGRCLGNAHCDGATHNTESDLEHCGECNHRCSDGTTCITGECLSGQGPMICNGIIIDSRSDSANCGSCGHRCGTGLQCIDSTCKRITDLSTATITCNAQTVTPYNDKSNCAGCGIACASGYACYAGNCVESVDIGDIITFGHYEQDTINGPEPIEWRVLDIDSDGHLLIISDKVLDTRPYNATNISVTYEKSTIRSWLNGYDTEDYNYTSNNFIDTAFTPEEKARIITSTVPAHANPHYSSVHAGNATSDKIFLLSVVEAESYFTTSEARKAYATFYAVYRDVNAYNYNTSKECTISNYQVNGCSASWWLRSPGQSSSLVGSYYAAYVRRNGGVGDYFVHYGGVGVRPALWINWYL